MLNYFKATVGTMAENSMQADTFSFDDADPSDTRRAHREAREAFGGKAHVSVWRRAATVASYVPAIGEPTSDGEAMQPGQRSAKAGDAAGAGLGCEGGAE